MAQAEPDAAAKKWLDKAAKHYSQGPYSLTYSMDMAITQQGMAVSIDAIGELLYGGPKSMKMNLDLTMSMPTVMPEPMKMKTLIVSDGGTLWTEVDNPLMGGKQVSKMSAEAAAEQANKVGTMGGMDPSQLDPASQIEMYGKMADLRVREISGEVVRLGGPVTEEFGSSLAPMVGDLGDSELTLVLSEATGELREMTLGSADAPLVTARFQDLKFLKAEDISPDAFAYTPPEGVAVQDMSTLSGAGGG